MKAKGLVFLAFFVALTANSSLGNVRIPDNASRKYSFSLNFLHFTAILWFGMAR
jgi:hypothetical protein